MLNKIGKYYVTFWEYLFAWIGFIIFKFIYLWVALIVLWLFWDWLINRCYY